MTMIFRYWILIIRKFHISYHYPKKKKNIYIYFISTMSLAFGILEELQDNLVEFSHFMSS